MQSGMTVKQYFRNLEGNYSQPWILYPGKLSFKCESAIKIFLLVNIQGFRKDTSYASLPQKSLQGYVAPRLQIKKEVIRSRKQQLQPRKELSKMSKVMVKGSSRKVTME